MPFAMGAVVEGVSSDFQTPLSGHFSPVFAVVPTPAMSSPSSCSKMATNNHGILFQFVATVFLLIEILASKGTLVVVGIFVGSEVNGAG